MSDRLAIETVDLWKRYDDVEALRGLDLRVPAGSICGFLGKNGAGKTTTIKVLLGMARATKGEARLLGTAAADDAAGAAVRRRVGFVSDEKDLYDYMTVGEIIAFTRPFFPKWRADLEQKYLAKFELSAGPRDQGAVARHAHQAGAPARALPRRGAADSRRAHRGPRSGDGRRRVAGAGRPRRQRGDDGVLLLAPDCGSRSDRRSRGHRRSRPHGDQRQP